MYEHVPVPRGDGSEQVVPEQSAVLPTAAVCRRLTAGLAALGLTAAMTACTPTEHPEQEPRPTAPYSDTSRPQPEPDSTAPSPTPESSVPAPAQHPNVLVFLLDDENDFSPQSMQVLMPKTYKLLGSGLRFYTQAEATDPECCPSRGQILTGERPPNNGVERQVDSANIDQTHTLEYALQTHGYYTIGEDKYLNGTTVNDNLPYWTRYDWRGNYYYRNFRTDENGKIIHVPGYSEKHYGPEALRDLRLAHQAEKPFFLYYATRTPHSQVGDRQGVVPQGRYRHKPVPSLNASAIEHATADKMPIFRATRPQTSLDYLRRLNADRERAVLSQDDEFAKMIRLLKHENELQNTLIIFTSDNGMELGQNNWTGKMTPYPGSTNVPFFVYYPRLFPGGVDDRLTGMLDIAPTIYDVTGIKPNHELDGHSLLSEYRRTEQFDEYYHDPSSLLEAGRREELMPSWYALHSEAPYGDKMLFVVYLKHHQMIHPELYDLTTDPYAKRNLLYGSAAFGQGWLNALVAQDELSIQRLSSCHGTVEDGSSNPCT